VFTQEEQTTYAWQLIIPQIGEEGEEKLKQSHILVEGLWGSGSLSLIYLTSLGIGCLKVTIMGPFSCLI
jgi:molybdopterin/thiamine biosynthesis adenylyltransferase